MEKKLNLYQKLLEIQKHIIGLGKDKAAYGYKYVTGDKVLEYIKPLMNEQGVLLKQEVLSIENARQDYQTKQGNTSEINSKVMMRFTWIDAETGEKDENLFGANGQNAWDKGVGSALTYGERYFLLKFFHIATDEDDIDNPERKPEEAPQQQKKAQPKQEPQKEQKQPEEPITASQQELMLKLINSGAFTQKQKDDLVASLAKYSKAKASAAIEKMKKTVEEYNATKKQAA